MCNSAMENLEVNKTTTINNSNKITFIYKSLSICHHQFNGSDFQLVYSWNREDIKEWVVDAVVATYKDLCIHMWCFNGSTVLKSFKVEWNNFSSNVNTKMISELEDWFLFNHNMDIIVKKLKMYSVFS
jgi:hypothetical protein